MDTLIKSLDQALETERLYVNPLKAIDAAAAFESLQNDDLYKWISMAKPRSVESLAVDWSSVESMLSSDGKEIWLAWLVTRKFDGAPIGCVDACIDAEMIALNFGYYFFVNSWGKGYATEAASVVIERFTRTIPGNDMIRGTSVYDDEYVLEWA